MSFGSCSDLRSLPENCIATMLSLTSPMDVCRLSLVSAMFRSAAESDAVWERFLPPDYRDLISRSFDGGDLFIDSFRSKKELYFHLCDHPIIIDGGKKSFSMEKRTGKKCIMLGAKDLSISWGDTPGDWQWISVPGSRFRVVVELVAVCWFDVRGKINIRTLSSRTKYAAYLVFALSRGIHGFEYYPVKVMVGIRGKDGVKRTDREEERHSYPTEPAHLFFNHGVPRIFGRQSDLSSEHITKYATVRQGAWMEVELGEFFVNDEQDSDMEISLTETKNGNWKGGIVIQGIEIRPKTVE